VEAGERLLTYDELLAGFGRVVEALEQAWAERHQEDESARRIVALTDEVVQRNLSDPQLSVCRLAELVAVSESHLRRTYREYRGVSLGEHLTLERVRAAQELLKRGESVKSVVRSVGYTNDSSFIRKFKSVVGVTPGEFRRTERSREEQPLGRRNRFG
jgi:AraC-like DNA-binding protein